MVQRPRIFAADAFSAVPCCPVGVALRWFFVGHGYPISGRDSFRCSFLHDVQVYIGTAPACLMLRVCHP